VKFVPFDEENRGNPFQGDFAGRPDHEPWGELAAGVHRQVTELAQRGYDPSIRHERLRMLQQRRAPRPAPSEPEGAGPEQPGAGAQQPGVGAGDSPNDTVTQFDFLPVVAGFDTLLVRGELLITAESYEGRAGRGQVRAAKDYLDALDMRVSEVDCIELQGRVLRLTHPELGPRDLSNVAKVLRRRGFTASLSNVTPTAPVMKAIGGPLPAPSPGSYQPDSSPGTPAKVAIIDTGIAAEQRADGWLRDIPRDGNIDPLDGLPLPAGDGYLDFDAGHGTFVAGIVQHVAPDAEIKVYRAVGSDGIAAEVRVACEMIRAVKDGAQILNLSLGCQTQDNVPPIAIRAALDVISELEREQGRKVLIVAAAGNYADTTPCWPAAFRRVVSVAALASDMQPAHWSSSGFWVTCCTIGQGVHSTYVKGRESPLADQAPHDFGPDAWAVWSGTSFAAPQLTGALARLHDRREPLGDTLRRLLAAGRPIPDFGYALKILPGI
jgi:subtilisin family serine protease